VLFIDPLYGSIDFKGTPYADLIYELLGCPEVQRLRHMRLMNFDVPYIQDLASTKRFPHSIGTCYLAYKTVEKSTLPINEKKKVVAAALIHDIGILPFGHLLESIIKTRNTEFSHEKLVYSILTGTYHPTNLYHQILGSESLRLHKVLKQNQISPAEIYKIICPVKGEQSAISADIDLDNIDNVHRMAFLLGYEKAKSNLQNLTDNIFIDNKLKLVFTPEGTSYAEEWLRMRQKIYTMIIGNPECVSYNAFLSKLLTIAVESNIFDKNDWYVIDANFESILLNNKSTKKLASWLFVQPHFELLDYIWFISNEKPKIDMIKIQNMILEQNIGIPRKSSFYFFWIENKLISREVSLRLSNNNIKQIGINSHSILVSLIAPSEFRLKPIKLGDNIKDKWRMDIYSYINSVLPEWNFTTKFPSDYQDTFFNSKISNEQLNLFR